MIELIRNKRRALIGTASALVFFIGAYCLLGPDSVYLEPYNSDASFPVVMSNSTEFNPYWLYFLGQDRFGAWPFLAMRLVRFLCGIFWTPAGVSAGMIAVFSLSLLCLAFLFRRYYTVAILGFATVAILNDGLRHFLFDIAQPYAWQIPTVLVTWCMFRSFIDKARSTTAIRRTLVSLLFLFALLSIWMSLASFPMILSIAVVEVLLSKRNQQSSWRSYNLKGFVPPFVAIGLAACVEKVFRVLQGSYTQKQFPNIKIHTNLQLEFGRVFSNFHQLFRTLSKNGWAGLYSVGFITFLILLTLQMRGRRFAASNDDDDDCRDFRVVTQLFLLGLVNFVLLALVSWVRLNGYSLRYMAPTILFWGAASYVSIAQLLALLLKGKKRLVLGLLSIVALAILVANLPTRNVHGFLPKAIDAAKEMERIAPHAILTGGYWGTYVFTSLQQKAPLIPAPFEWETSRTPWTRGEYLPHQVPVLMSFYNTEGLGRPESPPQYLGFFARLLKLENKGAVSAGSIAIAQYREVDPQQYEALNLETPCSENSTFLRFHTSSHYNSVWIHFAPRDGQNLDVWAKGPGVILARNTQGEPVLPDHIERWHGLLTARWNSVIRDFSEVELHAPEGQERDFCVIDFAKVSASL